MEPISPALDFLHDVGTRIAAADPLHEVLNEIVEFVTDFVSCDSCFIYVLEQDELVLRASKNSHPEVLDRLTIHLGQGITGWVAEHHEPVVSGTQCSARPAIPPIRRIGRRYLRILPLDPGNFACPPRRCHQRPAPGSVCVFPSRDQSDFDNRPPRRRSHRDGAPERRSQRTLRQAGIKETNRARQGDSPKRTRYQRGTSLRNAPEGSARSPHLHEGRRRSCPLIPTTCVAPANSAAQKNLSSPYSKASAAESAGTPPLRCLPQFPSAL